MPSIRSLASKRRAYIVAVILLLSKIMPSCFRCIEKRLFYITILALSSRQPFFYAEYTCANIQSSYDI